MLSPIIDVFVSGGPLNDAIKYILIMAGIVLIIALGQYVVIVQWQDLLRR